MNFSAIDRTLKSWALRNRVPLSTKYQDTEVRSFELIGPGGRAQIWIEINGEIAVHLWDYRKRTEKITADETTLADCLDQALKIASAWCGIS